MTTAQAWTRPSWTSAEQVLNLIAPDTPNAAAHGQPLHAWFATLQNDGRLAEAVMFLAHALPRYECVTWGAQALLEIGAADRLDPLMVAVLRWIDQPSDALRREAGHLADATRRNSPARGLAHAAMLSGGSMAPPELPAVLPPPQVCAAMVAGAILSGVTATSDAPTALRRALTLGEPFAYAR